MPSETPGAILFAQNKSEFAGLCYQSLCCFSWLCLLNETDCLDFSETKRNKN